MPPEDDVTNGGLADVVPTADLRWSKNKFYTRKPKIPKPEPAPTPEASGDDIAFSTPLPHPSSVMSSSSPPPPPPPQPPPPPPESATEMTWPPTEDKNDGAAIVNRMISIDLHSYTKTELRQLRRKLAAELDQVRSMLRRTEEFLGADTAPTAAECENSQHSIYITEPEPTTAESHNLNKSPNLVAASGGDFELSPNSHFSNQNRNLVVVGRDFQLSPDSHNYLYKVNQNQDPNLVTAGCSNFEFSPNNHSYNDLKNASRYPVEHDSLVVDKEMISLPERNLFLGRKLDSAFKSCGSLLTRLMRHKFGWVFNKPVDVRGLGLYDYYTIIREPMDLGTVKMRLSKKRYETPSEFARDVRLTFNNAMRYNPKGQDVHFMAEQLLKIFEERWPAIEAASAYCSPPPLLPRPPLPAKPHWLVAHPGRNQALDKPKAKDLHKRDMTMDEKGRLRSRLEDLPVEKLDGIVQIIHKRTSNLNQNDNEIEVDFEILDAETLWELDRYVTNYKKSLSKHKRKAELAMLAKQETEQKRMQERVLEPVVVEQSMLNNQVVANPTPRRENRTGSPSESRSSGTSSSDSGSSSSSGPDSDSSSECGSDAAH